MKIYMLLVFGFISCLQKISAQDYEPVKSDRVAYFANGYGNIKCIRIDSVSGQADSIYHPFANIGMLNYDCYTPRGPSWIGNKVIARKDGYHIFFNRNNDTIKLKTNASLHESWTAYKLPDSTIIIAEVAAIDTLSFLGLLDSVKTIEFRVYNKSMSPVTHILNDMHVVVSKKFGFIRILNFNLFPNLEPDNFNWDPLNEFNLVGLSKPEIGIQNLTWLEVFDFQAGDEIHVSYESRGMGYHELTRTIEKYLERYDFTDSIIYKIERIKSINKDWVVEGFYNYIHDTITLRVRRDSLFDKLPGESITSPYESFFYSMNIGNFLTKTKPSEYNKIWPSDDSCWINCCIDDCAPSYNYYKGLGGPYYQCDHVFDIGGIENELLYYKKGNVTWGVPMVITEFSEVPLEPTIYIFPNPSIDKVWINAPGSEYPIVFELFGLSGQVLHQSTISNPATSVDLSKYGKGIFMYRLHYKDGNMINGKLIIE